MKIFIYILLGLVPLSIAAGGAIYAYHLGYNNGYQEGYTQNVELELKYHQKEILNLNSLVYYTETLLNRCKDNNRKLRKETTEIPPVVK